MKRKTYGMIGMLIACALLAQGDIQAELCLRPMPVDRLRPLAMAERSSDEPVMSEKDPSVYRCMHTVRQAIGKEALVSAVSALRDALFDAYSPRTVYEAHPAVEQGVHMLLELLEEPREGGAGVMDLAESCLHGAAFAWNYPRTQPAFFRALTRIRNKAARAGEQSDPATAQRLREADRMLENLLSDTANNAPFSNESFQYMVQCVSRFMPTIINMDQMEAATVYGILDSAEDFFTLGLKVRLSIGRAAHKANLLMIRKAAGAENDRERIMVLLWEELASGKEAIDKKYIQTINMPGNRERYLKELQGLVMDYIKLTQMLFGGEQQSNIGRIGHLFYGDNQPLRIKAGCWLLWLAKFGNTKALEALRAAASDPVIDMIRKDWERRNAALDSQYGFKTRALPAYELSVSPSTIERDTSSGMAAVSI